MEDKPLINRLLSGIVIFKLKGKYVTVKSAKVEDKAFADFYSQEVYESSLIDGLLTNDEAEKLLIEKGWWSQELEENLKTLNSNLEQMKVDYYVNFFKEDTRKYIKEAIKRQNNNILALHEKKTLFFDKTCEYLRDFANISILVTKNATFLNGDLVVDQVPSAKLINTYLQNSLSESQVRGVAKNYAWRSIWNCKEIGSIFNCNACDLNDEQKSLIGWSRFYDGVYESLERPNEEIIKDDIALDGWSISEERKRKEEEKKSEGEKMLSDNMKNAGEVLIPVKNKREQENVLALNDSYGKSVLRSKKKQFAKGGTFNENELNHVKQEIQMEGFRQAKESRRR